MLFVAHHLARLWSQQLLQWCSDSCLLLVQGIMEGISSENEAGGAGGSSSYQALKRMDEQWLRMRSMKPGKPATYDPLPVSEAFAQVFVFKKP